MPSDAVIAVDVGTTATKAIVFDPERGTLAEGERPVVLTSAHPGWAEEDPESWSTNVLELILEVPAAAGTATVRAIAVTGMVPALICLDEHGRPLRNSIQQNDARADRQIDVLRAEFDPAGVLRRTGSGITQQSIGPKVAWLRDHEPEVLRDTAAICGSYDYIARRLTGRPTPVEANWALESGLYDFRAGAWAEDICRACGVDANWLGSVVPPGAIVGAMGEIPVIAGGADHVAGALAAGVSRPGDVVIELGGAGNILAFSSQAVTDERLYLDYHLVPGAWLPNGCMATTGSLVRWFQRELAAGTPLGQLDAEAEAAGPGAGGLVLTPYFLGEKTPVNDPLARGTLIGLHLGHQRGHVFRAVLEATAYGFRHHVDVLRELGIAADRISLTGGGAASALWRQIIADVLGLPVLWRRQRSGAAIGVALAAGIAIGAIDSWDQAGRLAGNGELIEPRAELAGLHDQGYGVYRSVYLATVEQQHALGRFGRR